MRYIRVIDAHNGTLVGITNKWKIRVFRARGFHIITINVFILKENHMSLVPYLMLYKNNGQ